MDGKMAHVINSVSFGEVIELIVSNHLSIFFLPYHHAAFINRN